MKRKDLIEVTPEQGLRITALNAAIQCNTIPLATLQIAQKFEEYLKTGELPE